MTEDRFSIVPLDESHPSKVYAWAYRLCRESGVSEMALSLGVEPTRAAVIGVMTEGLARDAHRAAVDGCTAGFAAYEAARP